MTKSKHLLSLKKVVDVQRKKFGITTKFSYRFNNKTPYNLIMTYSIPMLISNKGKPVIRRKRIQKNISQITTSNYKKWFKEKTSFLKDCANDVEKHQNSAEERFDNYRDEFDFGFWKQSFLSRKVGKTKTMKELSPHTIKQNKRIIEPYYLWCMSKDETSNEMTSHIDNSAEWHEEYYQEKLLGGTWSSTTCHTAFRNIPGFYNYVADRSKNKFPYDILKRLDIKKGENKRDKINDWEYDKIIDFILANSDDVFWGKFILLLRLQLKFGMKVGELVSIRNRDIDENNKSILISGKTGARTLYFQHDDDEKIWNDLIKKKTDAIYLFYRTKVRKYPKQGFKRELDVDKKLHSTESYYLQRFREMVELLGLRGKGIISSHSLRRYFITRFVGETKDSHLCRQIVGHTSTRMTDEYVRNMIEPNKKLTISIGV